MKPMLFVIAASLALVTGCAHQAAYDVTPIHYETVPGKVDGQWFERAINTRDGLSTIELVYCPIVPKQPTVCRTGVVYTFNRSLLTEAR